MKERKNISAADFSHHRPKQWPTRISYERYFVIDGAIKKRILKTNLRNGSGNELKAMHDINYVTSDEFTPF